jgi:DNA-binding response OmpR family regulator
VENLGAVFAPGPSISTISAATYRGVGSINGLMKFVDWRIKPPANTVFPNTAPSIICRFDAISSSYDRLPITCEADVHSAKKSIVLLDSPHEDAAALCNMLTDAGYDCLCARSLDLARAAIQKERPEVILINWDIPGACGLLDSIKNTIGHSDATILVLSKRHDDRSRAAALKRGAHDYINKPYSSWFLLSKILTSFRASVLKTGTRKSLVTGPLKANLETQVVRVEQRVVALTTIEFQLLAALLSARGAVVDRLQLMRVIRGSAEFRNPSTINAHVSAIRRKLGKRAAGWLRTIRSRGYAIRAPDNATLQE